MNRDALPPGWDPPQRKLPTMPEALTWADGSYCDRCGAVVYDWSLHLEWHTNLASAATISGAAVTILSDAIGATSKKDWSPDVRAAVKWALERAEGKS